MAGILMIAAGLTGIGYWLYQQPAIAADAARNELTAATQTLQPTIGILLSLDLAVGEANASQQLVNVNAEARSLFDIAGTLPNTLSRERSIAADIAGQALEGSRILNDAYAYRSAVIPILEQPEFETDPSLIALDDAAATFGLWQNRFQGVAAALPTGIMSALGDELNLISGKLDALQTGYLDALRTGDIGDVALVTGELETTLEAAEAILSTEFDQMASAALVEFANAEESIRLLLG